MILSVAVPSGTFVTGEKTERRYKTTLGINALLFFDTLIISSISMFSGNAFAAETIAIASGIASMGYLAAAFSTSLVCIGGGIAVSAATSAALSAVSEDGSILGKSLVFVGPAGGVCLYGLIISFMILGRL